MMEQVRLCSVWPMENWLGSSLNQIQGWTTVRESYSPALEQGPLTEMRDDGLGGPAVAVWGMNVDSSVCLPSPLSPPATPGPPTGLSLPALIVQK